jgi:hypothetical protein
MSMSLIHFHRFLIASAIVFCVGFGGWVFMAYLRDGGTGSLLLALAFVLAGGVLSYYLARLRHFLRLPPGPPAGTPRR